MFNIKTIGKILFGVILVSNIYGMGKKEVNDVTIVYKSNTNSSASLSFFNDFSIENNQVNIRCLISFMNNTNTIKKIMIVGFFDEDVKGGLLKENKLFGYYNNNVIIELVPGENKFMEIIFRGEFGGRGVKHDRNLPKKMEIHIIE